MKRWVEPLQVLRHLFLHLALDAAAQHDRADPEAGAVQQWVSQVWRGRRSGGSRAGQAVRRMAVSAPVKRPQLSRCAAWCSRPSAVTE